MMMLIIIIREDSNETLNQGVYMHAKRSRVPISSHCRSSVDYELKHSLCAKHNVKRSESVQERRTALYKSDKY